MISLAIISLVTSFSLYFAQSSIGYKYVQSDQNQLWQLLKQGKEYAIFKGITTTICPVNNNFVCSNNWAELPIMLFIDLNDDKIINGNDRILHTMTISANSDLTWRNNNRFIKFLSYGSVNQLGTFRYCKRLKQDYLGFQLIVSRAGRIRLQRVNLHCGNNV